MNRYLALLLACLSGTLLVLLYPPFDWSWFAPVALTPLLLCCAGERDWRWRFGLGYLCGILYWFGLCSWIQWTLSQYAGVSDPAAWALFGLFCLAKALQMGIFGLLSGPLMQSRFALPAVAALWVAIEWTHGVLGFEWLHLGNAGSEMSLPLRAAPIAGVWGVSFVFAVMSATIAAALLRRPRLHLAWVFLLPGLLFLPDVPAAEHGDSTAILLQPNLSETTVWTPELVDRSLREMTMVSLGPTLAGKPPSLIVWPEDPAPFYEDDPSYRGALEDLARTGQTFVVAGAVGRSATGAPLNSALSIGPDKRLIGRYDKVNLVPFGEFVPWPFKEITRQVSTEAGEFQAGRSVVVSQTGPHKVGTFICYESVFPGFIRQFVQQGAEVLVNISNDGWFGKSAARYQHLRIVRMRAVENRRWILRATNNGVTVAIDPAGRVMQAGPEFVESALRAHYRYLQDRTIYTRFGDWFVVLCFLIAAAVLTVRFRAVRQRVSESPPPAVPR